MKLYIQDGKQAINGEKKKKKYKNCNIFFFIKSMYRQKVTW